MKKITKLKVKRSLKKTASMSVKKLNFHYPQHTEGSKHARDLRDRANKLDDQQRLGLLERAMHRLTYGKTKPASAVGTGH